MNTQTPTAGNKSRTKSPVNPNNPQEGHADQVEPQATNDLEAIADASEAPQAKPANASGAPPSKVDLLVGLAEDACELFHDPSHTPYARMHGGIVLRIEGHQFKRWLQREYRLTVKRAANPASLKSAINEIAATALYEGPQQDVSLRVGKHENSVVLDLGGVDATAVMVDASGWTITEPPVNFERKPHAQAMPAPDQGASLDELRDLLNVESDADFKLIVGWLTMALKPTGPKPILILQGEPGSAKSTATEVLKRLVDPTKPVLRSLPGGERDLALAGAANWVLAFDNVSFLGSDMSDALCRLSTGAGFATRTLYANDEETVFEQTRPVVMNGLDAIATRQDLLSRSIVVRLPEIPPEKRQSDDEFWNRFELARPGILATLLNGVSAAIANHSEINLPELPRMADFATWVTAAEPALGWTRGSFVAAFLQNNAESLKTSLESSLLAEKIQGALTDGIALEGTPSQVLGILNTRIQPEERRAKGWPRNAAVMSRQLTLIKSALRETGVVVDQGHQGRGKDKERWLAITEAPVGKEVS